MSSRGILLSLLKFFNFLLLLGGLFVLGYSCWMYKQWKTSDSVQYSASPSSIPRVLSFSKFESELSLKRNIPQSTYSPSRSKFLLENVISDNESVPWFIYVCFGIGFILTSIPLVGAISAEIDSHFILFIYQIGLIVLIAAEGILIGLSIFDESWEEDFLPFDPTGEVEKAEEFVSDHLNLCKWMAIAIIAIELINLLLVIVLRAMKHNFSEGEEVDEQEAASDSIPPQPSTSSSLRQSLLNKRENLHNFLEQKGWKKTEGEEIQKLKSISPQLSSSTSLSAIRTSEPSNSNPWSKRMLEKYGLDINQFSHPPLPQDLPISQCEIEPKRKKCQIM